MNHNIEIYSAGLKCGFLEHSWIIRLEQKQMYQNIIVGGASLPEGTLCLTFDDGPGETHGADSERGPRTLAIAQFLNQQGVPATFFVVGKFASNLPAVLPQLKGLGHLIGNHTYDHPNLVDYARAAGDVISQVARVDGLICNWIDAPVVLFRPPYGAWNADIANSLNSNLTVALSHVGPIGWDIDGKDFLYWANNWSPQACMENYMREIDVHKRGIVLLHDCTAGRDVIKGLNRTLELVKLLIPALREQGYQFSRLDAVPDIAVRTQNVVRLALKGSNGLYVSPQASGGGTIVVDGPSIGPWESLDLVDLHVSKVALTAKNGKYFSSPSGDGGSVVANSPTVGDRERFDLISLGNNQVAFRAITGQYLSCDNDAGNMLIVKGGIEQSSIFTYEYLQ
jgi:peptidoglycan/xylan/chitin deacetylase (PgdA/CDA1 family)